MDIDFLRKLLSTPSVSGFESAAVDVFKEYLFPYVDECYTDIIGNGYAIINKRKNEHSLKVMIEAHIDEIGYQVIYINDGGFVYIRPNGGVDIQCLPGSQVVIYTSSREQISGVTGKKPIHLSSSEERVKCIELENIWVDTGLNSDDVKKKITIGDVVTVKPNMIHIGNLISSKSLDDKIGVFIVGEVMKKLASTKELDCIIYGVASVQEEVGCRGSITSSYSISPDIAISIDVDFATDIPDCSHKRFGNISLGNGPILAKNMDNDCLLVQQTESIAREFNINYQISARPYCTGGTNAAKIQLTRHGIRTLTIGIPCRYMHTPVEVCDINDAQAAIELIYETILKLRK